MAHVNTVLGPVEPEELGPTAVHEHILWGPPGWELDPDWWYSMPRVLAKCVEDLTDFFEAGGRTIVDVSGIGMGRDVHMYREVSRRSGVQVVACTGFWAGKGILPWFSEKDVDYLEELFVHEITWGIDGTEAKAGIIKIGAAMLEFTDLEQRQARAAARAARRTGVAVTTHGVEFAEQLLDTLLDEGLEPDRIAIGHLDDVVERDVGRDIRLAKRGAFISYDSCGTTDAAIVNHYIGDYDFRADMIRDVVDAGLVSNLVLSADVNSFSLGWQRSSPYVGKAVVGEFMRFLPHLRRVGITDEQIQQITVENPRRLLTIE